jgi:hypothetical protein
MSDLCLPRFRSGAHRPSVDTLFEPALPCRQSTPLARVCLFRARGRSSLTRPPRAPPFDPSTRAGAAREGVVDEDLRWPRAHPSLRREVKNPSPNSPLTLCTTIPGYPVRGSHPHRAGWDGPAAHRCGGDRFLRPPEITVYRRHPFGLTVRHRTAERPSPQVRPRQYLLEWLLCAPYKQTHLAVSSRRK